MSAQVDAVRGEVRAGDRSWRFDLDGRGGAVAVHLGGGRVRLRPHSWRAKRVLARFAHLGEAFVRNQFVLSCLDESAALPEDEAERDALLALALWLSAPGVEPPLPLDQRVLAAVTVQVCRATHSTPTALDDLDAADVELMWRAARGEADGSPPEPAEGTRILIVPDAGAAAAERPGGIEPEPPAPTILSRPEPTATAASPGYPSGVALPSPASSLRSAPLTPVDTAGRPAPALAAALASRDDGRRAPATSRSASRPGGRFRVSRGPLAPAAPASAPIAVASASFAERRAATVTVGATPPAAAAAPPRPWPWPVSGTSLAVAGAPGLATLEAHAPPAAGPRAVVASPAPAVPDADGPAFAGPRPAAGALGLADDLFDELAVRLEQAAGELGIDLEP